MKMTIQIMINYMHRYFTALDGFLSKEAYERTLDDSRMMTSEWFGQAHAYEKEGMRESEKPEVCARRCAAAMMAKMGLDPAGLRPVPVKTKPIPKERKPKPEPKPTPWTGPGIFDD